MLVFANQRMLPHNMRNRSKREAICCEKRPRGHEVFDDSRAVRSAILRAMCLQTYIWNDWSKVMSAGQCRLFKATGPEGT